MTVILVFTKTIVLSRIRQPALSRETGNSVNDDHTKIVVLSWIRQSTLSRKMGNSVKWRSYRFLPKQSCCLGFDNQPTLSRETGNSVNDDHTGFYENCCTVLNPTVITTATAPNSANAFWVHVPLSAYWISFQKVKFGEEVMTVRILPTIFETAFKQWQTYLLVTHP